MTFKYNIEDLQTIANEVIKIANNKVFLFYGEMGAGKTTLIKELTKCLGSTDNVSSPTFSIVNEYDTDNKSIYHFDLYRIEDQYDVMSFGFEEYLDSGNWVFIEWPERIPDLLPQSFTTINIEIVNFNERKITITN
jgi:tRNA threonylcarbamoyladenosine biosynthesis protein TsaE